MIISHSHSSDPLSYHSLASLAVLVWPWEEAAISGPGAVAKPATWKAEIANSDPAQTFKFQRNTFVLSHSLVKIQYCGQPPWPRGIVLGLRPPGVEFRILCLEGSVISLISTSSGGSPDSVQPTGNWDVSMRWQSLPCLYFYWGKETISSFQNEKWTIENQWACCPYPIQLWFNLYVHIGGLKLHSFHFIKFGLILIHRMVWIAAALRWIKMTLFYQIPMYIPFFPFQYFDVLFSWYVTTKAFMYGRGSIKARFGLTPDLYYDAEPKGSNCSLKR